MELSNEQNKFIEIALTGKNVLVDACIGSGKTTTIQEFCNKVPYNKNVLYLTYNKLLKFDAKARIKRYNVNVTNYHGFAFSILKENNISCGISDLIQMFIKVKPNFKRKYDILIIDEYQDIDEEISEMLWHIKNSFPNIQILAVGDLDQKIYDKTTLNVKNFIKSYLSEYETISFTKCFRLSKNIAATLGDIWKKKIEGVNPNCKISFIPKDKITYYLSEFNPSDILCLGSRNGTMATVLNELEETYPHKFNKNTVYATIDDENRGAVNPDKSVAIFTTYDGSKGMERKVCVVFDYTQGYWQVRARQPLVNIDILRNVFCVAASRGKEQIIFVTNDKDPYLDSNTLKNNTVEHGKLDKVNISEMFDFKLVEHVEACYNLVNKKKIDRVNHTRINVKENDALIDLSPCVGIYQEAMFFDNYNIEKQIEFYNMFNNDRKVIYKDNLSLEENILALVAGETSQNRYKFQVKIPFINEFEKNQIKERLSEEFCPYEDVQIECSVDFDKFIAKGKVDVLKNDCVYELKFVNELTHTHFLQCAMYVVALNLEKGYLWNIKDNTMYEVTVPDKNAFLKAVVICASKGMITEYR